MSKFKLVHYINQFYAGIGGEEKADTAPFKKDEAVGPGMAFSNALGDDYEIVGTVVCGDSYFNEHDDALDQVLDMIKSYQPDLVIAGPAFNAGRYGMAAGAVSQAVMEQLDIPAVTGMYEENPGVEIYKKFAYIVSVGNSAASMRKAVPAMSNLVNKILNDQETSPSEDGYFTRYRKNFNTDKRGSLRAVEMLVKKLRQEEYETEYPMPDFDKVEPGKALDKLEGAKIALVTSGGIVPKGNPDHIESSSASKYGKYDISNVDDLDSDSYETAHGGYDPSYANEDSDRVLPVDVLREKEKSGEIGELFPYFYTTTGNGTAVASAKQFASEIAGELEENGVDAVILTST